MGVKACHRLSMQDWLPGRWMQVERNEGRGREDRMGNRKKLGAPTRKVKKHEKDKDNMESVCKERSFPGRLEKSMI